MNASSYPELGYKAYGKCGKYAVDLALWFSQTGFCFAYVFFVKENFHKVLLQISDNKIDVSTNTFAIGCFFLFTLLCFVRKIEIFASTHVFADLMIVLTMLTVIIYGCKEIKQNNMILVSQVDYINTVTYADAIGYSVYCFEGIGVIMPV